MMCEIPRLGNIVAPQALRKVLGTSPPTKALRHLKSSPMECDGNVLLTGLQAERFGSLVP